MSHRPFKASIPDFETLSNLKCLNWDDDDVKRTIMSGQSETVNRYGLAEMSETDKVVVFDEIHKYTRWKQFLKGFYDVYGRNIRIVATGSAKMDVYKKGGDSMMGRYFPYRMHPLTVAELLDVTIPDEGLVRTPRELESHLQVGGEDDIIFTSWEKCSLTSLGSAHR